MQLTFEPVRLTRFAILALAGATALSVGACSSSKNSGSPATSSPATSSPASATGADTVLGLIASVSGNSVQVTEKTGTATVDVSPSTRVIEYTKAQLTDIAAGNCVTVFSEPASASGGAVTATSVQLNPPAGGGKCPQPKNAPHTVGTVASVAGNTIKVTVTDANGNPSETDVTVTDKTHYTKGNPETSQAIAQGKCINTAGTKDGGGTLQATLVYLTSATNGGCPQYGVSGQPH